MNDNKLTDFLKKIAIDYDDYLQSVTGLYAFCISAAWKESIRDLAPESIIKIPSKIYTKDHKEDFLTPDSIVTIDDRYSIIAEMKKHFANGKTKHFDQIKKYDNDFFDFWTDEKIPRQDLVLLTHYLSKTNAIDTFQEWLKKNNYERKFAIVEFNYTNQADVSFTLGLSYGELSDPEHNEALRTIKPIPNDIIVDLLSKYKFYDGTPPIIYMMQIIYDELLPTYIKLDEEDSGSGYHIKINLQEARDKLQNLFVPPKLNKSSNSIPKLEWVKNAFESFVQIGLAKKNHQSDNTYIIELKTKVKEDTKDFLAKKIYKLNNKIEKVTTSEPDLFGDFKKDKK